MIITVASDVLLTYCIAQKWFNGKAFNAKVSMLKRLGSSFRNLGHWQMCFCTRLLEDLANNTKHFWLSRNATILVKKFNE